MIGDSSLGTMPLGLIPAKRACKPRSGRCQLWRKGWEVYPVSDASGKTMILAPLPAARRASVSILAAFSFTASLLPILEEHCTAATLTSLGRTRLLTPESPENAPKRPLKHAGHESHGE